MVGYLVSAILEKKEEFYPREFPGEGAKKSTSRGYVQVYRSEMDQSGVKFLPLIPGDLEIDGIMAGIYREVARKLMYPAYQIHPQNLIHEFSCFYRGITLEAQEMMPEILRNLAIFQSLCEEGAKTPPLFCSSHIEAKIGGIFGALKVLNPLYGFFHDLRNGMETDSTENLGMENPFEAMLVPVKICIDLLNQVYHLPSTSGLLPTT
jgi:hypothetical protein